MSENQAPHDTFSCWAEVSGNKAAQLVRLTAHDEGNRYTARPIAFDAQGGTEIVGTLTLTVTNLAEPADSNGRAPPDTDAIAVDAGGRWVVFVRPLSLAVFPAKVVASLGGSAYTVREQVATGPGTFADAPGAVDLTAHNLAELSLGSGAAVDTGTILTVRATLDNGNPPTTRYIFDHPAYAKYLD